MRTLGCCGYDSIGSDYSPWIFGCGLVFPFGVGGFWAISMCFDMLGIVFRGKCYMNTLPFAEIGMWGFCCFFAYILSWGSRSFGPRG